MAHPNTAAGSRVATVPGYRPRGAWRELLWRLGLIGVLCVSQIAGAQARFRPRAEEPEWFKWRITEVDAGAYAEGTYEEGRFGNDSRSTYERFFIGPLVGASVAGSVYHPNLFQFSASGEGSYGWVEQSVHSGGQTTHTEEWDYLGNFSGTANILANKPYNGTLFGSYGRSFREYDFFNRVEISAWNYGAHLGYTRPGLTVTMTYAHHDEDTDNLTGFHETVTVTNVVNGTNVVVTTNHVQTFSQPSTVHQDVVTFNALNDRKTGSSTFNYNFSQYTRSDLGGTGQNTDHSISLSDSERISQRVRLQTSANYTHRENETETSDEVVASSNVEIEHGANFRSTWDFNFDHFQSPDFQSDNYAGVATLHHQLYQSLNSALSLNASDFEVSGASGEGFVRHFGIAWGEIYTKHLAQDHRLRINNTLAVDHTEEQNLNQVENERHTFGAGGGGAPPDSFFLNLPNVLEFTIVVTDQNDSQPAYVEGADYLVSRQGVLTLIERTGTSRIPAGSSVLLDYRAEPRPAASYETISESFGVRLDLWKNLWGIYANVSRSENNAPAAAVALEVTSYTAGTDVHWRWLNAGAEYNIYDSDQSQFRSARLFQNFNFRPDEASTLAMNFSQAFTEFVDSHREEEDYRFITRYRRFFQRNLGLNVEGGVDFRKGTGVDQTLATARADLNYTVGRTTMKVAYDYEYSLFLDSDERSRHMLTFRVKRVF